MSGFDPGAELAAQQEQQAALQAQLQQQQAALQAQQQEQQAALQQQLQQQQQNVQREVQEQQRQAQMNFERAQQQQRSFSEPTTSSGGRFGLLIVLAIAVALGAWWWISSHNLAHR
jgi:cobalamin biosynthesis Mg chelatase CobN